MMVVGFSPEACSIGFSKSTPIVVEGASEVVSSRSPDLQALKTSMDATKSKTVQPGYSLFKIEIADLKIFMKPSPGPPVIPGKTNLSLPDDNPESVQNIGPKAAPANVHGFVGKGRFQNYASVPGGRF